MSTETESQPFFSRNTLLGILAIAAVVGVPRLLLEFPTAESAAVMAGAVVGAIIGSLLFAAIIVIPIRFLWRVYLRQRNS